MDNRFFVVGLGPGSPEYILPAAIKAFNEADSVIGAARSLQSVEKILQVKNRLLPMQDMRAISEYICRNIGNEKIAVAVSGDTGFYSALDYLKKYVRADMEVIPGLSSFQYFYAKLQKSYKNALLLSMHGRDSCYMQYVRENKEVFLLLDDRHTPAIIAKELLDAGLGERRVYIGENLSYADERITKAAAAQICEFEAAGLSVMVIENE